MCHARHMFGAKEAGLDTLVKQMQKCPLRGAMAPWWAGGEWLDLLNELSALHIAHVRLSLSPVLGDEDLTLVLSEFERARSHVLAAVVLKCAHWLEPPHLVFGVAHPAKDVARRCWERCVESKCQHPRIQALKHPRMIEQASRFFYEDQSDLDTKDAKDVAGSSSKSLSAWSAFRTFVGELRFMWTAERAVEGDHARFAKRGKGAPRHTVHYLNFARRSTELTTLLQRHPEMILELGSSLAIMSSPFQAVKALGLIRHPSLSIAKSKNAQGECIQICPGVRVGLLG